MLRGEKTQQRKTFSSCQTLDSLLDCGRFLYDDPISGGHAKMTSKLIWLRSTLFSIIICPVGKILFFLEKNFFMRNKNFIMDMFRLFRSWLTHGTSVVVVHTVERCELIFCHGNKRRPTGSSWMCEGKWGSWEIKGLKGLTFRGNFSSFEYSFLIIAHSIRQFYSTRFFFPFFSFFLFQLFHLFLLLLKQYTHRSLLFSAHSSVVFRIENAYF